jgi:hypothetical protein
MYSERINSTKRNKNNVLQSMGYLSSNNKQIVYNLNEPGSTPIAVLKAPFHGLQLLGLANGLHRNKGNSQGSKCGRSSLLTAFIQHSGL